MSADTPAATSTEPTVAPATTTAAAPSEPDVGVKDLQQGKRALANRQFEDALDLFSEGLRVRVEKYGETGTETAEAYFLYGHALLSKVEKECDVFGGDVKTEVDEKENSGTGTAKAAEPVAEEEEPDQEAVEDDLESAFELLEVARVIASKEADMKVLLAKVHTRLGDLYVWQEMFDLAIGEYQTALKIREEIWPKTHTDIAATMVDIGMAYVWWMSATKKDGAAASNGAAGSSAGPSTSAPTVAERKTGALEYYEKAKTLYQLRVDQAKSENSDTLARDESTLSEISLKIDELRATNAEGDPTLKRPNPSTETATTPATGNGVTTIGFGGQTKANEGVTTIGFGKPSVSSAAPANNLGVFGRKAKRPRVEPVTPAKPAESTEKESS